jgi:hypothetical protein
MSEIGSVAVVLGVMAVVIFTASACARDARRRGKNPVLVTLLVMGSFPLGLIMWLLFRPEPLADEGRPRFRLEDHRLQ